MCIASPTCEYFTWKDVEKKKECWYSNCWEEIVHDYKCQLLPLDGLTLNKPMLVWDLILNKHLPIWKYGPRNCLSNFNPGQLDKHK